MVAIRRGWSGMSGVEQDRSRYFLEREAKGTLPSEKMQKKEIGIGHHYFAVLGRLIGDLKIGQLKTTRRSRWFIESTPHFFKDCV